MGWKTKCDLTAEDAQYIYCANGPAAVLFSVLFGLTFLVHLAQAFLFRKRFCWVIVVGSGWQCIGLIMRTYSTIDQTKTSTAAAGQLLVLLTPLWVNAFVYMIFGRMVYYYVPDQRVAGIKAQSLAKVFIWLDILSFIVQATGGIMDSDFSPEVTKIGLHIYTAGIAVQQLFILCFVVLLVSFHRRMLQGYGNIERGMNWKMLSYAMYVTLGFITIRIIYRLVEFADTDKAGTSPLSTHEAYFYCLECLMIFFAMVIWNIWHPGRLMPGPDSEFPKKIKMSRSEKKRLKREEKEARKSGRRRSSSRKNTRISEYHLTRSSNDDGFEHGGGHYDADGRWPLDQLETGRGGHGR